MAPVIRAAEPSDRPAIFRLFARVFGVEVQPEEWVWKYDRNPFRAVSAVAVAEGERIVGYYGGFATRYRGAEGSLPGVSAVDVMTDPSARTLGNRGLFRTMGEEAYRLNAALGIPFYFGFPNERARVMGERLLGYRSIEPSGLLVRPLWKPRASALVRLKKRIAGLTIVRGERFGEAHSSLAERLHTSPGWRTDRSANVLNWRFFERPNVPYHTLQLFDRRGNSCGYAVLRVVEGRALVVDLQIFPERRTNLSVLLEAIASESVAIGASIVEIRLPRGGSLAVRLREELGFEDAPSDAHFEVRPLDAAFDIDRAGRGFDYRYIDHDIF